MIMRLKGIKQVTVRKGGKVYVYYRHRKTGTVIKAEPSTAAFAAEAAALDAKAQRAGSLPGTFGGLIEAYRKSPEHCNLATRTRLDYERVFLFLERARNTALTDIDAGSIYETRDIAFKKHGRRFSTYVIQVMRLTLEWGRRRNIVAANAAQGVKAIRRPKDAPKVNRAWTDSERETILTAASPVLRTVIALGMFAGLREGDAIRLPWSAYERSIIASVARKTGEPLWIPAHYRLRQILDTTPKRSTIIATNSRGQAWTESGFRASFFKLTRKLRAEGKIGAGLTFHGLRHTVGKLIIDAGGDTRDVQAILGHASEASSAHYSREADQRKRATATVRKLERNERRHEDKQRTLLDNSKNGAS